MTLALIGEEEVQPDSEYHGNPQQSGQRWKQLSALQL
jgi:hypothetical protein